MDLSLPENPDVQNYYDSKVTIEPGTFPNTVEQFRIVEKVPLY